MPKKRPTPLQNTGLSEGVETGPAAGAQDLVSASLGSPETASTIKTEQLPMQKKLGPMEAAEMVVRGQEKEKWDLVEAGKKRTVVTKYGFQPYFKPKFQNQVKLILHQENLVRGNTYRSLIVRHCPLEEAKRLFMMNREEAQAEHERRKKLPNYGFPVFKRPKAA